MAYGDIDIGRMSLALKSILEGTELVTPSAPTDLQMDQPAIPEEPTLGERGLRWWAENVEPGPVGMAMGALQLGQAGVGKLAGTLAPEAYRRAFERNLELTPPEFREDTAIQLQKAPGLGEVIMESVLPGQRGPWGEMFKTSGGLLGNIAGDPLTYAGGVGLIPKVRALGKAAIEGPGAAAKILQTARAARALRTVAAQEPRIARSMELARKGAKTATELEGLKVFEAAERAKAALAAAKEATGVFPEALEKAGRGRLAFEAAKTAAAGPGAALLYAPQAVLGTEIGAEQAARRVARGEVGAAVPAALQAGIMGALAGAMGRGLGQEFLPATRLERGLKAKIEAGELTPEQATVVKAVGKAEPGAGGAAAGLDEIVQGLGEPTPRPVETVEQAPAAAPEAVEQPVVTRQAPVEQPPPEAAVAPAAGVSRPGPTIDEVFDFALHELQVGIPVPGKSGPRVNTSILQRRFRIGFSEASALLDELEKRGVAVERPQRATRAAPPVRQAAEEQPILVEPLPEPPAAGQPIRVGSEEDPRVVAARDLVPPTPEQSRVLAEAELFTTGKEQGARVTPAGVRPPRSAKAAEMAARIKAEDEAAAAPKAKLSKKAARAVRDGILTLNHLAEYKKPGVPTDARGELETVFRAAPDEKSGIVAVQNYVTQKVGDAAARAAEAAAARKAPAPTVPTQPPLPGFEMIAPSQMEWARVRTPEAAERELSSASSRLAQQYGLTPEQAAALSAVGSGSFRDGMAATAKLLGATNRVRQVQGAYARAMDAMETRAAELAPPETAARVAEEVGAGMRAAEPRPLAPEPEIPPKRESWPAGEALKEREAVAEPARREARAEQEWTQRYDHALARNLESGIGEEEARRMASEEAQAFARAGERPPRQERPSAAERWGATWFRQESPEEAAARQRQSVEAEKQRRAEVLAAAKPPEPEAPGPPRPQPTTRTVELTEQDKTRIRELNEEQKKPKEERRWWKAAYDRALAALTARGVSEKKAKAGASKKADAEIKAFDELFDSSKGQRARLDATIERTEAALARKDINPAERSQLQVRLDVARETRQQLIASTRKALAEWDPTEGMAGLKARRAEYEMLMQHDAATARMEALSTESKGGQPSERAMVEGFVRQMSRVESRRAVEGVGELDRAEAHSLAIARAITTWRAETGQRGLYRIYKHALRNELNNLRRAAESAASVRSKALDVVRAVATHPRAEEGAEVRPESGEPRQPFHPGRQAEPGLKEEDEARALATIGLRPGQERTEALRPRIEWIIRRAQMLARQGEPEKLVFGGAEPERNARRAWDLYVATQNGKKINAWAAENGVHPNVAQRWNAAIAEAVLDLGQRTWQSEAGLQAYANIKSRGLAKAVEGAARAAEEATAERPAPRSAVEALARLPRTIIRAVVDPIVRSAGRIRAASATQDLKHASAALRAILERIVPGAKLPSARKGASEIPDLAHQIATLIHAQWLHSVDESITRGPALDLLNISGVRRRQAPENWRPMETAMSREELMRQRPRVKNAILAEVQRLSETAAESPEVAVRQMLDAKAALLRLGLVAEPSNKAFREALGQVKAAREALGRGEQVEGAVGGPLGPLADDVLGTIFKDQAPPSLGQYRRMYGAGAKMETAKELELAERFGRGPWGIVGVEGGEKAGSFIFRPRDAPDSPVLRGLVEETVAGTPVTRTKTAAAVAEAEQGMPAIIFHVEASSKARLAELHDAIGRLAKAAGADDRRVVYVTVNDRLGTDPASLSGAAGLYHVTDARGRQFYRVTPDAKLVEMLGLGPVRNELFETKPGFAPSKARVWTADDMDRALAFAHDLIQTGATSEAYRASMVRRFGDRVRGVMRGIYFAVRNALRSFTPGARDERLAAQALEWVRANVAEPGQGEARPFRVKPLAEWSADDWKQWSEWFPNAFRSGPWIGDSGLKVIDVLSDGDKRVVDILSRIPELARNYSDALDELAKAAEIEGAGRAYGFIPSFELYGANIGFKQAGEEQRIVINPAGLHALAADALSERVRAGTMSAAEAKKALPEEIASRIVDTLIHELAHHGGLEDGTPAHTAAIARILRATKESGVYYERVQTIAEGLRANKGRELEALQAAAEAGLAAERRREFGAELQARARDERSAEVGGRGGEVPEHVGTAAGGERGGAARAPGVPEGGGVRPGARLPAGGRGAPELVPTAAAGERGAPESRDPGLTKGLILRLYDEELPKRDGLKSMPIPMIWERYKADAEARGVRPDPEAFRALLTEMKEGAEAALAVHDAPFNLTQEVRDLVPKRISGEGIGRDVGYEYYFTPTKLGREAVDDTAIREAALELNPGFAKNAMVPIARLRVLLKDRFPDKESFDAAMLRFGKQHELVPHPVPSQMTAAEKATAISGGGDVYYIAARKGKAEIPDWTPPARIAEDRQAVIEAAHRLDPNPGSLIYIQKLRAALARRFKNKDEFDRAILRMGNDPSTPEGAWHLQAHPTPSQLTPEEKGAMIPDGRGSYFMAFGLREPAKPEIATQKAAEIAGMARKKYGQVERLEYLDPEELSSRRFSVDDRAASKVFGRYAKGLHPADPGATAFVQQLEYAFSSLAHGLKRKGEPLAESVVLDGATVSELPHGAVVGDRPHAEWEAPRGLTLSIPRLRAGTPEAAAKKIVGEMLDALVSEVRPRDAADFSEMRDKAIAILSKKGRLEEAEKDILNGLRNNDVFTDLFSETPSPEIAGMAMPWRRGTPEQRAERMTSEMIGDQTTREAQEAFKAGTVMPNFMDLAQAMTPAEVRQYANAKPQGGKLADGTVVPDFPVNLQKMPFASDEARAAFYKAWELGGGPRQRADRRTTFAEANALVRQLFDMNTPDDVATRHGKIKAPLFVKTLAAQATVQDRLRNLWAAEEEYARARTRPWDTAGKDKAETMLALARQQYAATRAFWSGEGGSTEELGRALAMMRLDKLKLDDQAQFEESYIKSLIAHRVPRGQSFDLLHAYYRAKRSGDWDSYEMALRAAIDPSLFRTALEAWKANMLGYPSQMANIASNTGMAALRDVEQALAAGLDKVISGFTGAPRERYVGEVGAAMRGARRALTEAFPVWAKERMDAVLLRPEDFSRLQQGSALDYSVVPGAIGGKTGRFIRQPFRFLETDDAFFKHLSRVQEYYRVAYRKIKQGQWQLQPGETLNHALDRIGDTLALVASNPGEAKRQGLWTRELEGIARTAMETAKRDTYQKELGPFGQAVTRLANQYPALDLLIPFKRTPANITKEALARTPLGFYNVFRKWREVRRTGEGRGELMDELAKTMLGSAMSMVFAGMALNGDIEGGGPEDPRLRTAKESTGWIPYSVRVGDAYYGYSRLEPFASMLGSSADFADAYRRGDLAKADKIALKLFSIFTENFTNKTFLSGLSNMFEFMADPNRQAKRFATQMTSSLMPNVLGVVPVGNLAKAMDPNVRTVDPFSLDIVKAKTPWWSETLPAKLTPTGEPLQRHGPAWVRLWNPVYYSPVKTGPWSDVGAELDRLNFSVSAPAEAIRIGHVKVDLDQQERRALVRSHNMATVHLAQTLKSRAYQEAPDDDLDPRYEQLLPNGERRKTKVDLIKAIYRRYHDPVLDRIRPRIRARAGAERQELRNKTWILGRPRVDVEGRRPEVG